MPRHLLAIDWKMGVYDPIVPLFNVTQVSYIPERVFDDTEALVFHSPSFSDEVIRLVDSALDRDVPVFLHGSYGDGFKERYGQRVQLLRYYDDFFASIRELFGSEPPRK